MSKPNLVPDSLPHSKIKFNNWFNMELHLLSIWSTLLKPVTRKRLPFLSEHDIVPAFFSQNLLSGDYYWYFISIYTPKCT